LWLLPLPLVLAWLKPFTCGMAYFEKPKRLSSSLETRPKADGVRPVPDPFRLCGRVVTSAVSCSNA